MFLGAHVSAAGSVVDAVSRGVEIGAECVQIFASSPRTWATKEVPKDVGLEFQEANKKANLGPPLIHSKYLVSLGSLDDEQVKKSVAVLKADMVSAYNIGAVGVVFHPASHRGQGLDKVLDRFCNALKEVLDSTPDGPYLMLENSAGMGDHIGSKFEELAKIIDRTKSKKLGICLDTQHAWAAGNDISTKEGVSGMFSKIDSLIGLDKLHVIHLNDSKFELGVPKDRHENIGLGHIGEEGFKNFFSNLPNDSLPLYLEVPGIEGGGPDKPNIEKIKELRKAITN